MLSLLPDFFWHVLTLGGIAAVFAALFLGKIPFVSTYKLPLKYGGMAAVLFGIWMEGGIANEAKWQAKVQEMEAKVAKAEQESKDANAELAAKSKEKVKVIKGKTEYITRYIEREVTKYDSKFGPGGQCELPKEVIESINKSAETPKK